MVTMATTVSIVTTYVLHYVGDGGKGCEKLLPALTNQSKALIQ